MGEIGLVEPGEFYTASVVGDGGFLDSFEAVAAEVLVLEVGDFALDSDGFSGLYLVDGRDE